MKSKDKTKQKKHESTIGKIIYGFLLFMPLLAIAVTCAYVIFNKNAYQSYYGDTINEITYENVTNFEEDITYQFVNSNSGSNLVENNSENDLTITQFKLLSANAGADVTWLNDNANIINNIRFANSGTTNIYIRFSTTDNQRRDISLLTNIAFEFEYVSGSIVNQYLKSIFKTIVYNKSSFLSNVFYYSIDEVEQSPLFSWAENSAIYTGMNATCNALNITTTFIPLLLTYWLIISVIYFLYDIILIILHVFHRKIHELEESI